ncbi:RcnB family protein [Sphingomonas sp. PvP056]|uniref:RcnB family protein n=1 Tax=Sphingomonas sp. PvP056 TaxID=3156392 RepID=UPI003397A197
MNGRGNDWQNGNGRGGDIRGANRGWNGGNRGWNGGNGAWNRDWRRDNRFNYGTYRRQNYAAYRLPRYYAPSGWGYGYRRFGIGFQLNSLLFRQDYWIDNADYYRLPPAYGPYRWVRYYNDALLVDVRTGNVVDTVYDIFW